MEGVTNTLDAGVTSIMDNDKMGTEMQRVGQGIIVEKTLEEV
jgi:hypothetical protein